MSDTSKKTGELIDRVAYNDWMYTATLIAGIGLIAFCGIRLIDWHLADYALSIGGIAFALGMIVTRRLF